MREFLVSHRVSTIITEKVMANTRSHAISLCRDDFEGVAVDAAEDETREPTAWRAAPMLDT